MLVTVKDGSQNLVRRLGPTDAIEFGRFLHGLSDDTRRRYEPHKLTHDEGIAIAKRQPEAEYLRLIASEVEQEQVHAYIVCDYAFPPEYIARYLHYGVTLPGPVARIAPVVADNRQNNGLGTEIVCAALRELAGRGVAFAILLGGVQETNFRARAVYAKTGFMPAGEFWENNCNNFDMYQALSTGTA